MSIISSVTRAVRNIIGDRKVTHGVFGSALAGGEIDTGLEICEFIAFTGTAAVAAGTAIVTLTEDLPRGGSAVPIIVEGSSNGGIWWAYGR